MAKSWLETFRASGTLCPVIFFFFCSMFVGTKGCSKELLHSYMKDQGSEEQPFSALPGHRWGSALDTQYLLV